MGCVAFGLPEFKVNRVLESTDGRSLRYEVETREKPTKCPSCGATGKLTIHASHNRDVHDLSICNTLIYWYISKLNLSDTNAMPVAKYFKSWTF